MEDGAATEPAGKIGAPTQVAVVECMGGSNGCAATDIVGLGSSGGGTWGADGVAVAGSAGSNGIGGCVNGGSKGSGAVGGGGGSGG